MELPDSPCCEVSTILITALKNKDVILNVLLFTLLLLSTGSSDEDFDRARTYLFTGIRRAKTLVNYPFFTIVFVFLLLLVVT